MKFFECAICKLNLPRNLAIPITVKHQGRVIKLLICERCKKRKEGEFNNV